MPQYAFKCPDCGDEFDRILKVANYDDPQECPECGVSPCPRQVVPVAFNLDGDGWPSKNGRVAAHMRAKNARLDVKMDERKRDAPGVRLVPNVGGEVVGSWSEAQKVAESKGKDGSSYEGKVQREKAGYK